MSYSRITTTSFALALLLFHVVPADAQAPPPPTVEEVETGERQQGDEETEEPSEEEETEEDSGEENRARDQGDDATSRVEVPEPPSMQDEPETIERDEEGSEYDDGYVPPPPPRPMDSGMLGGLFPDRAKLTRRSISAFDIGVMAGGTSLVAIQPEETFYYLNVGGGVGTKYIFAVGRSILPTVLVDTLVGLFLLGTELIEPDDFPPFIAIFNDVNSDDGVWELGNILVNFVANTSETDLLAFGLHSHLLLMADQSTPGSSPDVAIGVGAAGTYAYIADAWELAVSVMGGPEVLTDDGALYIGGDVTVRRAVAKRFGLYVRYNPIVHLASQRDDRFTGILEAGITLGNWE